MKCQLCKEETDLPFQCNYCGQYFCDDHRLPEQHMCPGLSKRSWGGERKEDILDGVARERVRGQIREKESVHRRANRRGRKRHWKPKLLVKTFFVIILLLCGVSVVAWKVGVLSEDINQEFDAIAIYLSNTIATISMSIDETQGNVTTYLQGLWMSIIGSVYVEDFSEPEAEPLNPFVSVDDLVRFLDNDNVSDVIYVSSFTCGDFAQALVNRAHDAGYDLRVYSMWDSELDDFKQYVESLEYVQNIEGGTLTTTFVYGFGSGHAICKTEIDSMTYVMEPQNDMVFRVIDDGYEIVYFGEVTKGK